MGDFGVRWHVVKRRELQELHAIDIYAGIFFPGRFYTFQLMFGASKQLIQLLFRIFNLTATIHNSQLVPGS